jgi:DNA-binding MarR family transcriptional regulator
MAEATLSASEYASLAEFRHLLRSFLAFSEAQARAAGLNPQQHQLLLAVMGFGAEAPTVGMLAERLLLRHHSTVELVDRLQKRGMVRRLRASHDRRVATVTITREGARLLARLSVAHRNELRQTRPKLVKALTSLSSPRSARPNARRTKKA